MDEQTRTGIILGTAFVTFFTGYIFGIYTTRGYIVSPELSENRRSVLRDPEESEESDVDEDDTLLDHAPNWANGLDADRKQGLSVANEKAKAKIPRPGQEVAPVKDTGEECKLVLVVRTDLGMTKGKIAAQCSHATLACYKTLFKASPGSPQRAILSRWEKLGQAKIAVQIKSQEEMMELRKKAKELGLTSEVIQDAGRTQIEAGSVTVLGVGPAPRSAVDKVTGHLKLL